MSLLSTISTGKTPKAPRVLIYGYEGCGKAQPLTAKILTPDGWSTMGDMKVGSKVIGRDGKAHNVIAVFPQGEKEVFKVEFRDGAITECCDEHLWFTQTRRERDQDFPGAVRDFKTVRSSLRYGRNFNHAVPRVDPVEFTVTQKPLPIDPWLLGIYLAEGNTSYSAIITNSEDDIQKRIVKSLPGEDHGTINEKAVRVCKDHLGSGPCEFAAALRAMGLADKISDTKFVPKQYLFASIEERTELLRGMMDGDGHVVKKGSIEICTASPQLAEDIVFLVRSLGGSANCKIRQGKYRKNGIVHVVKDSHRIYAIFNNGIVPVSSQKQLQKWGEQEWQIRNTIRNVESVGIKECQCIKIDSMESLYVTDDFIVTHNSTWASQAPNAIFVQTEDGLNHIDCAKFPLSKSFGDVMTALMAIRDEKHDYQTVVIDSLSGLEPFIFAEVCREFGVKSIEKADGGYARGYTHALTHWTYFRDLLDEINTKRNMMIVLIAHVGTQEVKDPETATYDRTCPRIHKKAEALISQWCDAVFQAKQKYRIQESAEGFNQKRAIATPLGAEGGERVIRTIGNAAVIAKNRFNLPEELPLNFNAFLEAINIDADVKVEVSQPEQPTKEK